MSSSLVAIATIPTRYQLVKEATVFACLATRVMRANYANAHVPMVESVKCAMGFDDTAGRLLSVAMNIQWRNRGVNV